MIYSHIRILLTAKSLQSCLTLCDPIDGSPIGSPIPGILQARTLEWVAISFSNAWKWKVKVKSLSRVWLLATPWTAAYQAPPSIGFSRQEYWSGVPLPSPIRTHLASKCMKSSVSSVQSLSHVGLFATHGLQTSGFPVHHSQNLLKLLSIELVMPSNNLMLYHPFLLLSSIFPSIRVFLNESLPRIRWPKYWSISFSISTFSEYSGLTSFRMDWLDLIAVQGTVKSLLQHHSWKAWILWHSTL